MDLATRFFCVPKEKESYICTDCYMTKRGSELKKPFLAWQKQVRSDKQETSVAWWCQFNSIGVGWSDLFLFYSNLHHTSKCTEYSKS